MPFPIGAVLALAAGLVVGADLRVDSTLVLIRVSVLDGEGRPVTWLQSRQFRVIEDGAEQRVTHFSQIEEPVSAGLVFDMSHSMRDRIESAARAAAEFLRTANAEDEFFLLEFGDRPRVAVPFTRDPGQIVRYLSRGRPEGRTSLVDGVYLALDEMRRARHPRKAILVLSDGGDNHSRYTLGEVRGLVRESGVQVYAIGLHPAGLLRDRTPEEQASRWLLRELAGAGGGRALEIEEIRDLPEAAARIGRELRSQYEIGYRPTNRSRDGRYRRVEVKLASPGAQRLRAYWRRGYYAPDL